jgi:hypothetical protein
MKLSWKVKAAGLASGLAIVSQGMAVLPAHAQCCVMGGQNAGQTMGQMSMPMGQPMDQPMNQPVAQTVPLQGQTEVQVPTVNVTFQDRVDPAQVQPGQSFQLVTNAPIMINNVVYPAGTVLTADAMVVQRPGAGNPGQVQLFMTGLKSPNGDFAVFARPEDIQATPAFQQQVAAANPGFFQRAIQAPFNLGGGLIGAVGTTGGDVLREVVGTTGGFLRNTGGALYNFVTLNPRAGFSNLGAALIGPFQGVGRIAGTTFTGGRNILTLTTNEAAYLVNPNLRATGSVIDAGQTVPLTFVQTTVSQQPVPVQ